MADNAKNKDPRSGAAIYEAERASLLARTEKLRALRLARDAEEAANKPPEPEKKPARKKSTRAVKAGASKEKLTDWMKSQRDGGRNN